MAFSSAPTLCEVTYNITEEEKRYTPFRYQCRSATTRANTPGGYSEITNYSLPSGLTVTYYEYLRSLYDSRIQSATKRAYRHCNSAHPTTGSRVGTCGSATLSECGSRRTGRPTTALPYVSPTHQSGSQSRTQDEFEDGQERSLDDKLVWVDALNKWVPENQLNSRPYVSFVGTAPTVEKLYSSLREQQRHDGVENAWCDRYDEHMKSFEQKAKQGMAPKQLQPEHSFINRMMALKKKEALRKKALDQLEQRRLRKGHSSPLYSSINERKQRVRFQMPRSTKVSPRESVVKEEQDYQKAWDDEVNTEDLKEKEIITDDTDAKDSNNSEVEEVSSVKEEKEEPPKRVERSQSEIDREDARRLMAAMAAKNKKQKQVEQVETKVVTKEIPAPKAEVVVEKEQVVVEEPPLPPQPSLPPPPQVKPSRGGKTLPPDPPSRSTKGVRWLDQVDELKKPKKAPKKDNLKPVPTDVKPSRHKTKNLIKIKSKSKDLKEEKIDLEECGTLISEETAHSITTIEDTKTGPLSLTVTTDRVQTPEDKPPPQPRKRIVVKKQFIPRERVKSESSDSTVSTVEEVEKPVTPEVEEPEETIVIAVVEPELPRVELDEPPLPDPSLLKSKETKGRSPQRSAIKPTVKLEQKLKKQRQFRRDTTYEEELRRQEEAERRRQRQMEMLEKMKARNKNGGGEVDSGDDARRFDNYGFLAKYCIFNKGSMEAYRRTFESVDEDRRGWIQGVEVMIALRGINQKISYNEEEYLYRVLELTGYNISQGADFKLFAVMAALSLRISALDSWMKNMIGSMDFKTLDTKMYMCKKLWECNVDPDTNKIPLEQLCIELRAGGISPEHEIEVRDKLGHLKALDLLDFLTYIPLFIMIHESVVDNPFNERREI